MARLAHHRADCVRWLGLGRNGNQARGVGRVRLQTRVAGQCDDWWQ